MTKPNHEAIAAENLRRQGYEFYCPRISEKKGLKTAIRPLFPRYIFVLIDRVWYSLKSTRGISYVLLACDGPAVIPENEIQKLKKREGKDGLVCLIPPPKFLHGDKVKTNEGPLAGQMLIYEGMTAKDRVKVLAQFLGRSVFVEMPEAALYAA